MSTFTRFIAALMTLIIGILVGIWVLQMGWGMTAKSWPVIIWGVVFQVILLGISTSISSKDD